MGCGLSSPAEPQQQAFDPVSPTNMPEAHPEAEILEAWSENAEAWTASVRGGHIRSRMEVTNDAIWHAVTRQEPEQVLDLGCGEGWLVRGLVAAGIDVRGVDATPALIERARQADDDDRYTVATYDEIADDPSAFGQFDLVVANFALLGEHSTERAVGALPALLRPGGTFVLQTVHPFMVADQGASGWRSGSWEGLGQGFTEAAPWYFRTVANWVVLLTETGMSLVRIEEPRNPRGMPASLLLTARSR